MDARTEIEQCRSDINHLPVHGCAGTAGKSRGSGTSVKYRDAVSFEAGSQVIGIKPDADKFR